ncbi:redox-regulated ATPase YchF [Owenweeksia hongkongensis]|uniref:redox-regulated ATPase YchF n=1 Tax=Owenweeksia hongkongensis TaxID=253245 RepID=UPI003A93E7C9
MKCGIVGLPNVGKSTLFNCLSNAKAQSANFPFCTIEPNVGMVTVPDSRLNKLEELVNPERVMPATVEIVDIAGLVKGASKGEGLGNKFLGNIRECNAIIHVLRCFENDNITHVDGSINPLRDKETIDFELQLKDLETLEKRVDKHRKAARTGNKSEQVIVDLLDRLKNHLEQGKSVRSFERNEDEDELIKESHFLTEKPILYLCNVDEAAAKDGNEWVEKVKEMAAEEGAEVIYLAAATEADISELESYEERTMFLEDLGLEEAGVNKVIRAAYDLLDLQTYFTAGVKEVRAWTIKKGFTAPQAAGVIHTDFEKGFIRAEVIAYEDYANYGSESKARDAGKLSVEGKEYVVQDGDVMHFRFNV